VTSTSSMTSLKRNIGYNFAYQLLILILPLITAPYLSRVIGAEGVGVYSYSYSIATYFVYFIKLGLDNYGNRSIASCQDDEVERSRTFWSIYTMQVFCFILAGAAYVAYSLILAGNFEVALLQGLYVLSALFDINWFFFGMELFKLTVIRNTIVKTTAAVLVFIFVKDPGDTGVYIAIMSGSYLVSQVVLWPFLRRYVHFVRPKRRDVLAHLKPNLVLFVPVIAISIYNTLSKIILGYMAGEVEVGFFENAAKVTSVPIALVTAIGTVMLPRTSALLAKGQNESARSHTDKTMVAVMAFTAVSAFGIPMISYPFVELFYGPGFDTTASVLIVLCATIPLLGFGNVIRTQYLIPAKRDSVFLWSAVCGAVTNLTVNLFLIPRLGSVGAAWASVAAETAVLLYQVVRVRREIPLSRYCAYAIAFLLPGAFMVVVLRSVGFASNNLWIQVFGTVGIGLAVYVPLALIAFLVIHRLTKLRIRNSRA
jgi:O-antigen/teichoic acid export membrane protein